MSQDHFTSLIQTLFAGAIFGIGGALAMFLYRHKDFFGQGSNHLLQQLGRTLALNVVYGLIMPNVDNWYDFHCSSACTACPGKLARSTQNKEHRGQQLTVRMPWQ